MTPWWSKGLGTPGVETRLRSRRGRPQFIPIFRAGNERISPPVDTGLSQRSHFLPLPFTLSVPLSLCPLPLLPPVHRTFNESFIPLLTPFGSVFIVKSFGMRLAAGGHRTSSLYYRLEVFKVAEGILWVKLLPESGKEWGQIPHGYFRGKCFGCYLPKDQPTRVRVAILELTQISDSPYIDPRWGFFIYITDLRVANKIFSLHGGFVVYSTVLPSYSTQRIKRKCTMTIENFFIRPSS